jgi:GNAT superfamily N-acetyltransferase
MGFGWHDQRLISGDVPFQPLPLPLGIQDDAPMGVVIVRSAEAADAAGVAHVHTVVWRQAYLDLLPDEFLAARTITGDFWLPLITSPDPRSAIMVAVEGDVVVGFAAVGPASPPADDSGAGQLYAIYLLDSYWGTGIGYQLHSAAIAELRRFAFPEAVLCVLFDNLRAIEFYQRRGWIDQGITFEDEREGLVARERLMRLNLTP